MAVLGFSSLFEAWYACPAVVYQQDGQQNPNANRGNSACLELNCDNLGRDEV